MRIILVCIPHMNILISLSKEATTETSQNIPPTSCYSSVKEPLLSNNSSYFIIFKWFLKKQDQDFLTFFFFFTKSLIFFRIVGYSSLFVEISGWLYLFLVGRIVSILDFEVWTLAQLVLNRIPQRKLFLCFLVFLLFSN